MSYRVRKMFRFEAAHILATAHSRACTACVHGHSYRVELFLVSRKLNKDGMVVDFGLLKEKCRAVFDRWDHALFLPRHIRLSMEVPDTGKVLRIMGNPTAERMARELFERLSADLRETLGKKIRVERVRVHETETGWAEYWED